jgi:hypothetical protein
MLKYLAGGVFNRRQIGGVMPNFSGYDITTLGNQFIPKVLADTVFKNNGVLYGDNDDLYWAVVNPNSHPLFVWAKKGNNKIGAYAAAAIKLGAVVFTNGPMMENPSSLSAIWSYSFFYFLYAVFTVLSVIAGYVVGGLMLGPITAIGGAFGGFLAGIVWGRWVAAKIIFQGAAPMGHVHGNRESVNDTRVDHPELYYLGRNLDDFSSYKVGPAPTPSMKEVIGGLIPLVLNFAPRTSTPGPNFHQSYANWTKSDGFTAWGLVPIDASNPILSSYHQQPTEGGGGSEVLTGVIVAVGHDVRWFSHLQLALRGPPAIMAKLAPILASIGTRDAIVMDGGDSVMIGDGSEFMVGPPPPEKDVWQEYGFCCQ